MYRNLTDVVKLLCVYYMVWWYNKLIRVERISNIYGTYICMWKVYSKANFISAILFTPKSIYVHFLKKNHKMASNNFVTDILI